MTSELSTLENEVREYRLQVRRGRYLLTDLAWFV